ASPPHFSNARFINGWHYGSRYIGLTESRHGLRWTSAKVVRHLPSSHPIWRISAFFLTASVIRKASSLLTQRSVRCRGPSACAMPTYTWTIICGSLGASVGLLIPSVL